MALWIIYPSDAIYKTTTQSEIDWMPQTSAEISAYLRDSAQTGTKQNVYTLYIKCTV